jgi:AcrR family transcriptional regulator
MRADARRNLERLLEAATAAFAEHGADACLEDIAERAGVGIGTLYRHFPTRRALVEAVYRDQIEALRAQANELLTAPSPEEALATWLRAVVRHSIVKRGLAEFLQAIMREEGSNLAWCREAMRAAGAALLERAQRAGVVRSDADINDVLRLTHAIALSVGPSSDGVDQTDRLLSIVLDGLRRSPSVAP